MKKAKPEMQKGEAKSFAPSLVSFISSRADIALDQQEEPMFIADREGKVLAISSALREALSMEPIEEESYTLNGFLGVEKAQMLIGRLRKEKKFYLKSEELFDGEFLGKGVCVQELPASIEGPSFYLFTFPGAYEATSADEIKPDFEDLFRRAPVGIFIYDNTGKVIDANNTLLKLLDSPSYEATCAINVLSFPLLKDSGISADLRKVLELDTYVENVRHYTSKWGKSLYVKYMVQPVAYKNGKVKLAQVFLEDYSVREFSSKELERAKQEAELAHQKSSALLKAIPDMMFVFSRDARIIDFQVQKVDLLYASADLFLGKYVDDVLPVDVAGLSKAKIDIVLRTQETQVYDYSLRINGIDYIFESRMVWVSKNRTLAIVRNVTEQRNAQQILLEAKRKAEESDLLKSAFLANMSHEIRTPMNSILGFSALMMEHEDLPEKTVRKIDVIHTSAHRLLRVINDILDFSKLETGQQKIYPEKCNVVKLLTNLSLKYKPLCSDKSLELSFELKDSPLGGIVKTDEVRLVQVLENLLDNAIKFTHSGSITFGLDMQSDELLFFVKDTGIGIAPEYHTHIFERFNQAGESTARDFGGSGLGLSICKGLVALLGGRIWVESEEGQGAAFYFTLPKFKEY